MKTVVKTVACGVFLGCASASFALDDCTGSDCIGALGLTIETQDVCNQVSSEATRDSRWQEGLSRNVDQEILGCTVVAFKINWFGGGDSGWIVPGVNDLDSKYNTSDGTVRRAWAYFYDHSHTRIQCCSASPGAGETVFSDVKDLRGNGVLHYNPWGTDYLYADGFCQIVKRCEAAADVKTVADGAYSCRCDNYWGCSGGSCTSAQGSWSRFSEVTCIGCPLAVQSGTPREKR
jgi:hypothetical protein